MGAISADYFGRQSCFHSSFVSQVDNTTQHLSIMTPLHLPVGSSILIEETLKTVT